MSDEDIRLLRLRLNQYVQANQTLQQENIDLRNRISELYSWTEIAQKTISERDQQIQALNLEIQRIQQEKQELVRREEERKQRGREMSIEQLYERVQTLEVENRDMKEILGDSIETLSKILMNSATTIDRETVGRIERILSQRKDPQSLVLIALRKKVSAAYSELAQVTGMTEQKVRIAADQLRRKGIVKEFGPNAITLEVVEARPKLPEPREWRTITDPKDLFSAVIEYVKISEDNRHIADALKQFRDVVTSLLGSPTFMYELGMEIKTFTTRMGNKEQLLNQIASWKLKWEDSTREVEVYGTKIDDPSSWSVDLILSELFDSMSRLVKKGKPKEISLALQKLRDILHEKHGHKLYLVEIVRESTSWRSGGRNREDLLTKLEQWQEKAT